MHCAAVPGEVQIAVSNDKGQDLPVTMQDNEDGTYQVDYCAVSPGTHAVTVLYGGQPVPQSPIRVQVQPHVDVSNIRVDGLEPSEYPAIPRAGVRAPARGFWGRDVLSSPKSTVET